MDTRPNLETHIFWFMLVKYCDIPSFLEILFDFRIFSGRCFRKDPPQHPRKKWPRKRLRSLEMVEKSELPSRGRSHIPAWEKENNLQMRLFRGYVSSQEGILCVLTMFWWTFSTHQRVSPINNTLQVATDHLKGGLLPNWSVYPMICLLSTILGGGWSHDFCTVNKEKKTMTEKLPDDSKVINSFSFIWSVCKSIWWNPTQPEVEKYRNRLVLLIFLFPSHCLPGIQVLGTNSMYTLNDHISQRKKTKKSSKVPAGRVIY